jgi:PEGA domain
MSSTLKGYAMKDNVITVRMTPRLAERVRRVAVRDEQTLGEWLRQAAIEKLNREERQSGGTAAPDYDAAQNQQAQTASTPETAKVHITSSPTGGEIYVDGKFFGNAPSDITLPAGEHLVKITIGGKEWSRTIEITPGEITVHADVTEQ